MTLGKNSRGYHYILANLVSNNGSRSPGEAGGTGSILRVGKVGVVGGGLVSAILPMHNKWIKGFCTRAIGPSVSLFTLAACAARASTAAALFTLKLTNEQT